MLLLRLSVSLVQPGLAGVLCTWVGRKRLGDVFGYVHVLLNISVKFILSVSKVVQSAYSRTWKKWGGISMGPATG